MHVEIRQAGDVFIVDLKGKLTAGLGDQILRETIDELLGEQKKKVLLNLSEVTFMDSAGVISGTSNLVGKFNFQVTARDTNGVSYTKTMSIDIIGAPPVLPSVNVNGNGGIDDCTLGVPCSRQFGSFNGGRAPFTWTASGMPPLVLK